LARNGRDWHTLLEFCTLVNSLIIDEDGVYDPKLTNDRLLLGMKGTFSELELSILRQRSQEALRLKARGDLHTSVAVGYVRDAALQAIADRERAGIERLRQTGLALEQARYEAARAHRQYDAVDPENRLVAGDLERRWNERLAEVARLEDSVRMARDERPPALTEAERAEILTLGTDLERLWNHPAASAATRKRILRAVLEEIIVTAEPGHLRVKLHWKGGDHTSLEVAKNRAGQHRWKTSATTEQLIRDLARLLPDGSIASLLNRLGTRTARGHTWTQQRVCVFRNDHNVAVYRDGERAERGELILREAADRLGASKMTVVRLIKDGILPAKQTCAGAPYVIREADLDLQEVRQTVKNGRAVSQDPRQRSFDYQ
jgi:excisionase family DNA binding protein